MPGNVTQLLSAMDSGDPKAAEELLPLVYDQLRRLAVHEALSDLEKEDRQVAELVKLRDFVGLSMPQAAEAMELPLRSAERLWSFGKVFLKARLRDR